MKKFLLIGDSLTEYGFTESGKWVSLLADLLVRRCDIVNRGYAGFNSSDIREILPDILEDLTPKSIWKVTILLGSNDAISPHYKNHVSAKKYIENITFIVDYLLNWGLEKRQIILITPPIKYSAQLTMEELEKQQIIEYAQELVKLSYEKLISCLDFNRIMINYGINYKDLLTDGLHFSGKGSQLLFDSLYRLLRDEIYRDLPYD